MTQYFFDLIPIGAIFLFHHYNFRANKAEPVNVTAASDSIHFHLDTLPQRLPLDSNYETLPTEKDEKNDQVKVKIVHSFVECHDSID